MKALRNFNTIFVVGVNWANILYYQREAANKEPEELLIYFHGLRTHI
jgi:hypothetical protein